MTHSLAPHLSPEERARLAASLARLERFSTLTDSQFRVPVLGIRFGIDPLVGLIPVIGDFVGLVLSLPVLLEAVRAGAPRALLRRMLRNMLIEFFGGLVPGVGDAFDVYWKANTRNTKLLREWLRTELVMPEEPKPLRRRILIGSLVIAGAIFLGVVVKQLLGM